MTLQHLRSSTANKRPTPAAMSDGQLAMNTNLASPGLFLKDSNGDLVKVGPVHVGTTAPNATPAAGGQAGNSKGEQWLDTTGGVYVFKIYDGTAWRSETGTFVDVNGDTMTGALGIIAGSAAAPGVFFSGDTNTGIYSPGADQVAVATNGTGRLFIDASGNIGVGVTPIDVAGYNSIQIGDTNGAFFDCFTGATHEARILSLPGDLRINQITSGSLGLYTNNTERLRITSAGLVGIGTSSPGAQLQVAAPSAGRSYSSSVLDFSNIHLDGITAGTVTSALTFSSGSGGGAAIAFSRGGSFQTEMSFWTCSTNVANSATQRMVIDSAGSVGIGTTSPNALLDVRSATAWVGDGTTDAFLQFNQSATAANRWHIGAGSGNALIFYKGTYGTGVETTRLDSSGKLLIGTSTAGTAKVSIQGATGNSTYAVEGLSVAVGGDTVNPNGRGVVAEFGAGGVADGAATHGATINLGASSVGLFGIRIIPGSAFAISDYYPGGAYVGAANPPTERMRINNVGNLLVGRTGTDGAALIQAPASSTVPSYGSATGVSTAITHFEFRNSNGLVGTISTNASATAYNTSSDYRLKENVIPVSDGIVRLQQLKPSRFNFIADSDQTVDGFIAHEVQAVVPECVTGEKDAVDEDGNPVYQGIDQSKLVPLLTAALQEAIAKIETLEARLTAAGIE